MKDRDFILEDIENVRKSPGGTINTARRKLQKRSAFTGGSGEELVDFHNSSSASELGILNDGQYKIAIVISHPIQYYVPWFQELSLCDNLELKVFYLWDQRVSGGSIDPDFRRKVVWDVDLLSGYDHEFVKNRSPLPGSSTFTGLFNPSLPKILAAYQPDAVLVYGYNYFTHLHLIVSPKLRHIPFLFRGDSHLIGSNPGKLKSVLLAKIFSRFRAFLAVGSANRRYFHAFDVADEQIFNCPHAINLSFFARTPEVQAQNEELRKQYQIPDDAFVFLYAGKFTEKKQVLELLNTFMDLKDRGAILLCAGSGELEEQMKEKVAQSSHIRILPFMNQSLMPALYSLADVFILPSFSMYETWGMSVQEALAMGVPALVSDQVGCAEDLIVPQKTGWIFKAGQYEDLLAKLKEILAHKERVPDMARETRSFIERNFSYTQSTEGLFKALSSIVNK